jgi:hypothetical protein
MIISEKQIYLLMQVLVDSLSIVGGSSPFNICRQTRKELSEQIINQQSEELKVIE